MFAVYVFVDFLLALDVLYTITNDKLNHATRFISSVCFALYLAVMIYATARL